VERRNPLHRFDLTYNVGHAPLMLLRHSFVPAILLQFSNIHALVPTETPVSPMESSMPSTPTPEHTSTPSRSVNLNRGINFGNMLEAPNEAD